MDSVLDFLFLRRLKFEYTTPPICPITLASASGISISGQVISPILAMSAPQVVGRFLTWPCSPGEVCFNIYFNNGGLLTEVATCIQPNTVLVCSAGCWRAAAVVNGVQGPLTDPVCTDGTPTAIELPAQPGASYNLYFNSDSMSPFGTYELVLSAIFCSAFETCTLGCYSVSAITGDGETPPSNPACNGGDPTITLTSPAAGTYDLPVTLMLTAVTNLNGHTPNAVRFYDGATLLGTVTGAGPYSIPFSPTVLGSHTLTAVLTYDSVLTVTSAPVVITVQVVIPGINDLLQQTESFDFDSIPNGTQITTWLDKTPHINNWSAGLGSTPAVDGTILLGGHKTVRFAGGGTFGGIMTSLSKFIPLGLTGMELMVIFKADADPAPLRNPVITYQETFNKGGGTASSWADQGANAVVAACGGPGPFYLETFCIDNTAASQANCGPFVNLGTPATNTATHFVCYNLSVKSGGPYDAFLDSEHFFTRPGGYPFLLQGTENLYTLGYGLSSDGSAAYFAGNIAAVYLWGRVLTPTERAQMRVYLTAIWGITF